MTLEEAIKESVKEKFIITCELAPPKGTDVSFLSEISLKLKNKVDAINLTDGQGGNMRMCPLAAATILLKNEIDVIWQLTCRDRNRIALQADCLGASILGIKNVLPMKGDDPKSGDHPEAKPVFDLDSLELIKAINELNNGKDLAGKELKGKTTLNVGCTAHPGLIDLKKQKEVIDEKFKNGASFIQTQISYDIQAIEKFVESLGNLSKKTLIGITPLKGIKMANFMNEKVFGVTIPKNILERMEKYTSPEDQNKEGLDISKEIVLKLKSFKVGGIHLMAVGQESQLPEIISYLTNSPN